MRDRGESKGYALLSYAVPLERDRSNLWDRVLTRLTPGARTVFEGTIYANSWYPRAHVHELFEAFDHETGRSEAEFRELGAMAARYQIHVVYRLFLKFASPAFVFRRAASVWQRQSTVGSFSVVEDADDHLVGELEDPDIPVGLPAIMAGWSDTVVAMLGRTPYPTTWEQVSRTKWRFRVSWLAR